MKLEKLKVENKKGFLSVIIVGVVLLITIVFTVSYAKYKNTKTIKLAEGTVNYKVPDLNIVAMYQQSAAGSSTYNEITTIPASGYKVNESKSYCNVNNVKDDNAVLKTIDGNHTIANLQKNSKCYLYFDVEAITSKYILDKLGITVTTGFTGISTSNEGVKAGKDDDGTTYYYRGNVTNNWVKFAGFYWRIIRINGDGTIRMIYNGTSTAKTGTGTQISTSAYNSSYTDNAYVGYMYGTTGSSSYAATHANNNNSTIKGVLDNWYKTNILDKGYDGKVDKSAGFCNDRSVASSSQAWMTGDTKKGYGTNATAYGPFSRAITISGSWNSTNTPTFKCKQSNDLFTTTIAEKGNKKLTYPIGLITMDEVIYAGGFGSKANSSYYLYTNQHYWTMSPSEFSPTSSYPASVFLVSSNGLLGCNGVYWTEPGVRPVINLKADTVFATGGNGTAGNPYIVQ